MALADRGTLRTRHGLVLLTTSLGHAPSLSRIIVPGADDIDPRLQQWAERRHLDVEQLKGHSSQGEGVGGGGFTAALQNLSDHSSATTASSTAKMIGYPISDVALDHGHATLRAVLFAVVSLTLAVLVGLAPAWFSRRRRRRAMADAASA